MLDEIIKIASLDYDWEKLNNKTILISGGTGFIGSMFIEVVSYRNKTFHSNIKIISLSRRGGEDNETVKYLKQDITKPFTLDEHVDYVLHLASNTHPKQYAEDPIGTITTNIFGCDNLMKIAVDSKARFLLASSVEIYGQGSPEPMKEDYSGYINCNQARSGYNESKRVCESLLQSYRAQKNLDALTVRFSRIFGADRKVDTKAMNQFMEKAVAGEDIILKSKGNQRFSYAYVADAVSSLFFLLINGKDGEAYNVSDDDEGLTLGGYAEYMASLGGKKVVYDIENNVFASSASYALLDTSKIRALGWKPMYSVKEGLRRTYEIKKNNLLDK